MSRKLNIERFNALVPKAAELHSTAWCVKRQAPVPTIRLRGEECVDCPKSVMNEGVCDPL